MLCPWCELISVIHSHGVASTPRPSDLGVVIANLRQQRHVRPEDPLHLC